MTRGERELVPPRKMDLLHVQSKWTVADLENAERRRRTIQLTRKGGFRAFESANRDFIYYANTPSDPDIWRVPSAGGQESPVSPRIHLQRWKDWALVDDGIFFPSEGSPSPRTVLKFFDFATARVRDVTTLEKPGEWISASADGKFVLYH